MIDGLVQEDCRWPRSFPDIARVIGLSADDSEVHREANSHRVYGIFGFRVDVAWGYTPMGPDGCAWLKRYWSVIFQFRQEPFHMLAATGRVLGCRALRCVHLLVSYACQSFEQYRVPTLVAVCLTRRCG